MEIRQQLLTMSRITVRSAVDSCSGESTVATMLAAHGLTWDQKKYQVISTASGEVLDPEQKVSVGDTFFIAPRFLFQV